MKSSYVNVKTEVLKDLCLDAIGVVLIHRHRRWEKMITDRINWSAKASQYGWITRKLAKAPNIAYTREEVIEHLKFEDSSRSWADSPWEENERWNQNLTDKFCELVNACKLSADGQVLVDTETLDTVRAWAKA